MDYKYKKMTQEKRIIIKKFLDCRKEYLNKNVTIFYKTRDLFERLQIAEYFKRNFSIYITGIMCLYEDSILYDCYNNLNEQEKLQNFYKFFVSFAKNEKLYFLSHYNYITKEEYMNTINISFLSYEQNILNFLECVKIGNPKFSYSY